MPVFCILKAFVKETMSDDENKAVTSQISEDETEEVINGDEGNDADEKITVEV